MASVKVTIVTEDRNLPPGTKAPHHYKVGLELQEVDLALDVKEHVFTNIEAGVKSGFSVTCAEDGTELHPLVIFSVPVPEEPQDVVVPVVISASGVVVG